MRAKAGDRSRRTTTSSRAGSRTTRRGSPAAGTRASATVNSTATALRVRSSSPTPTPCSARRRHRSAPVSGLGVAARTRSCSSPAPRAYNRWLAELCQDSPERRVGLALMPILADQDAAVNEIHKAFDAGLRGLMIPAMWNDYAPYHDAQVRQDLGGQPGARSAVAHAHRCGASRGLRPVLRDRHRGVRRGGRPVR